MCKTCCWRPSLWLSFAWWRVHFCRQDIDPAQLLLFIQSFGIHIESMTKLLSCIDDVCQRDSYTIEQVRIELWRHIETHVVDPVRDCSNNVWMHNIASKYVCMHCCRADSVVIAVVFSWSPIRSTCAKCWTFSTCAVRPAVTSLRVSSISANQPVVALFCNNPPVYFLQRVHIWHALTCSTTCIST